MESLGFLYLLNNNLNEIPQSIGSLKNLVQLHIGKNDLTTLPHTLGELESLSELNLIGSGPMLAIPSDICNLHSLEYLSVDRTAQLPICIQVKKSQLLKITVR
jgi:Leucine-rich repeat (LRR) protein